MRKNKILLIRTDAIGDYILFRNFLQEIKSSPKFKSSHLILLGNILWKDIAITYDATWVDQFIWVDMNKYSHSRIYRVWTHLRLKFLEVDILVCAVRTHRKYFEDEFVRRIKSPVKIGSGQESVKAENCIFSEFIYSEQKFEFEWNKSFLEQALKIRFNINEVYIKPKTSNYGNKILIFPSASEVQKTWSIDNFKEICKFIAIDLNEEIVLCGSDTVISEKIVASLSQARLIDTTGKTSLSELILLIETSKLIICNDSAALHIGAALHKKVICIYKGDYYGRFLPYNSQNIKVILHPDLKKFTVTELLEKYNAKICLSNIDHVEVDTVKEAIVNFL